jgi:NAD(P)-dependent dehydrogenase (short-subunit alcohol dehydrogenase family)
MNKLIGKTALVTGGGQGVGQGIAFALAAEGAKVAVTQPYDIIDGLVFRHPQDPADRSVYLVDDKV